MSVSVFAKRWEAREDALSWLAYLDHNNLRVSELNKKGFGKSWGMVPNDVYASRVSITKETLEHEVSDLSQEIAREIRWRWEQDGSKRGKEGARFER